MGEPTLTEAQVRAWIAYYDCGDERDAVVSYSEDGWAGPGWYVHCSSYPDEGSMFLGAELTPVIKAEVAHA